MNDIDLQNEVYFEEAYQQFEEAVETNDWKTARLILADMTEKGLSSKTWELYRRMNLAMASADSDFDGAENEMDIERDRENDHDSRLSSSAEGYGGSY